MSYEDWKEDDFLIEWTKGQPKNMIQLGMEISRTRGKLHSNAHLERLFSNPDEKAENLQFRYGALCILDQLHRMLDSYEVRDNQKKLLEIKKLVGQI